MVILAALLLASPYRVYVSNEASDDVAVIENDAVVAHIPVGKRPRGIRLGPGGKLYVRLRIARRTASRSSTSPAASRSAAFRAGPIRNRSISAPTAGFSMSPTRTQPR